MLTIRAEVADPPPYGQPDRKCLVFFTPSLKTLTGILLIIDLHSIERRILTAGWRDSAANVGESRESWEVVDATQNSGGCQCACQAG